MHLVQSTRPRKETVTACLLAWTMGMWWELFSKISQIIGQFGTNELLGIWNISSWAISTHFVLEFPSQAFLNFQGFNFGNFPFNLVYNSILFSSPLVLLSNLDLRGFCLRGLYFVSPHNRVNWGMPVINHYFYKKGIKWLYIWGWNMNLGWKKLGI